MTQSILPVIMSGGAGTRLWPLSHEGQPKQFHALMEPSTLIQATASRFRLPVGEAYFLPPLMIANARHGDLIEAQLKEIGMAPIAILLEPMGRNTAATAILAAEMGRRLAPGAAILLLPADHHIADPAALHAAIQKGAPFANDRIVTFGVAPKGPSTAYGYIEAGPALAEGVYSVQKFKEKPKQSVAEQLWNDGAHYWNAGIFLFSADVMIAEFDRAPDIRDCALAALNAAEPSGARIHLPAKEFSQTPEMPVDIAIMEETARGAIVPCEMGWTDIGSWSEIWRISPKTGSGDLVRGAVAALDTHDCLLLSDGVPLAAAGVSGLIIVATKNGVIVVPQDRAQDVKALLEKLNAAS